MRRYVNWFFADMIVTLIFIGITGFFWRSLGPLDVGYTKTVGIAIGFALLYSVVGALMGVNRESGQFLAWRLQQGDAGRLFRADHLLIHTSVGDDDPRRVG